MPAQLQALDDQRWHWHHGPIDLVVQAEGEARAVAEAHEAAWARFEGLLDELVAELPSLRRPVSEHASLRGPVARRMQAACLPFLPAFITPMAAVAGAVAQELIAFYQRPGITRAWINNGGDIALHLAPGTEARVGLYADLARFDPRDAERLRTDGQFSVAAADPVRGIATSGWRGRSFSLGIADSVTILAATAAQADAAASIVANAVDADHPAIERRPANECKDDSDLGALPVTVQVPPLPTTVVRDAVESGLRRATELQLHGLIHAAVIVCQGQWRVLSARDEAVLAPAVGSVFA
ncbi:MAG: UPF0280 family protein [Gammaproteobacteria bacterium]|uniref:UPF0280 family protein n=1 Tax=Pseudacidovorax sp. TaxID=1934311 RepID=UPI001B5AAC45|nr:UPF0280 family protein [Pseudacidovorax sp.]MBP6893256.1 UPF0280 family protein [Pseudacidovorax sp.]